MLLNSSLGSFSGNVVGLGAAVCEETLKVTFLVFGKSFCKVARISLGYLFLKSLFEAVLPFFFLLLLKKYKSDDLLFGY